MGRLMGIRRRTWVENQVALKTVSGLVTLLREAGIESTGVEGDRALAEAARRRGIWVTNTPDVLTEATADLAWALILAVTRRLGEAERLSLIPPGAAPEFT